MTVNDLTDKRGSHLNFETGTTKTTRSGRTTFEPKTNNHVFITD